MEVRELAIKLQNIKHLADQAWVLKDSPAFHGVIEGLDEAVGELTREFLNKETTK